MTYKIVISEITETEKPATTYENTGKKDDKGNDIWEYVKTGEMEIDRNTREIYQQEVEDLDIGELAIYINRAK